MRYNRLARRDAVTQILYQILYQCKVCFGTTRRSARQPRVRPFHSFSHAFSEPHHMRKTTRANSISSRPQSHSLPPFPPSWPPSPSNFGRRTTINTGYHHVALATFSCTTGAAMTRASAHLRHPRRLLNSHISSRTSTCIYSKAALLLVEESNMSSISVFSSFVSVRSPSLLAVRRHGTVRVVLAAASLSPSFFPSIVIFTSALETFPPSRPKFSNTGITPHLMAFLDGAHNLCIAWHSYGGWADKFEYEDHGRQWR